MCVLIPSTYTFFKGQFSVAFEYIVQISIQFTSKWIWNWNKFSRLCLNFVRFYRDVINTEIFVFQPNSTFLRLFFFFMGFRFFYNLLNSAALQKQTTSKNTLITSKRVAKLIYWWKPDTVSRRRCPRTLLPSFNKLWQLILRDALTFL